MGKLKYLIFSFFVLSLAYSQILIFLREGKHRSLDPAIQWNFLSSEILANVLEGLVQFKMDSYDVEPCLATKWEAKDNGKRWIFYLRKGVTFHDGTEFNADSVIFSFKRMENMPNFKVLFPFYRTIKKIDRYTVEIILDYAYTPFIQLMANPIASIISPQSVERREFVPIGTGPFKIKEIKSSSISLESFNKYWNGKPKIEGIIIKTVTKPEWKLLQLKNGSADIIRLSTLREYESLKFVPNIKFLIHPQMDINFLSFNTSRPPFNKRKVREAFAHIINKKNLIPLLFNNFATPAITPIPPYIWRYPLTFKDYDYNPEKALSLLKEAGYSKGFRCKLFVSSEKPEYRELALKIQKSAKLVGIKIEIVSLTPFQLHKEAKKGKYNLAIQGWVADIPDPDNFLFPLFSEDNLQNFSILRNTNIMEILKSARKLSGNNTRYLLYSKALEIIHREIPIIPLYHSTELVAYNIKVSGLQINPKGYLIFKKVRIKK